MEQLTNSVVAALEGYLHVYLRAPANWRLNVNLDVSLDRPPIVVRWAEVTAPFWNVTFEAV